MSDLENLQALKRMLENKDKDEEKNRLEREKKFISDATRAYLGETTSSSIQVYHPEAMIGFLSLPSSEIQRRMGGEWLSMDPMAFEAFAYTVKQKIQKSSTMIDWGK